MPPDPMPSPADVHPDFDGHPERPWRSLTPEEKIDWLWALHTLRLATRPHAGLPTVPGSPVKPS